MEKKQENKNEASETITEIISKLKKNEPKEGVSLLDITKKLSTRKFGKKK